MARSACAIYYCDKCGHLASGDCCGCSAGNLRQIQQGCDACKVYLCVSGQGLESCLQCGKPACGLRRAVESICPLRSRLEGRRWWAGRMSRALEKRGSGTPDARPTSARLIARLTSYLQALDTMADERYELVSSWQLAERVGANAALIRKDLSRFGEFGTPSSGYAVDVLRSALRDILGLNRSLSVVWVGPRSCGLSAQMLSGLSSNGFRLAMVFDEDPSGAGAENAYPLERMGDLLGSSEVDAAVIAISGPQAQYAADVLVEHGVTSILNLGGDSLVVPDHVKVRKIDLMSELLQLCFQERSQQC